MLGSGLRSNFFGLRVPQPKKGSGLHLACSAGVFWTHESHGAQNLAE